MKACLTQFALLLAVLFAGLASPAQAADDEFEFWIKPKAVIKLDGDTFLRIETAAKLREPSKKGDDTYYVDAWVVQKVSDKVSIAAGVERRFEIDARDEFRVQQAVVVEDGALRASVRVEERFLEDTHGRMGIRVRPRVGVAFDLDDHHKWQLEAHAEAFVTVRAAKEHADTGLTGIRTEIGVTHKVTDNLYVSLDYVRDQYIFDGYPDRVGHAPQIGMKFKF